MIAHEALASPTAPAAEEHERLLSAICTPEFDAEIDRAREAADAERPDVARRLMRDLRRDAAAGGVDIHFTLLTLKTLREHAGVSLTDLAAKAGMQKSSLSRLENGDANPTVRTLERVAAALGKRLVVRVEDLEEEGAEAAPTAPDS